MSSAACRRGILFCFVAALPIVFLSFSHYRDLRYAAPIFPVIAVAVGILATAAISRFRAVAGIVILLLAAGTADMLDATFGFTARYASELVCCYQFRGSNAIFTRTQRELPGHTAEILTAMEREGKWKVGIPHRLVLEIRHR